jgi:hypothetical protein
MSDYGNYPELGYFRAFVLCKDFPTSSNASKPRIPFTYWDVTADYPLDVVKCRDWINYGAPLTVTDSAFLYFTDYYVKDKSDGELGVLVCFDYKVYLVTPKHVYYGGVVCVPDCSVQVEFVNVTTDTFNLYLSDPLSLLGLPFATTFSQRLRKFREWTAVYPELNCIIDSWSVLNKDSLESCWIDADEGIVLQCFDALPVSYNSGRDRRGSMRYVKRVPTVDVSPDTTVDVCCGNNRYRITNAFKYVHEFLLSDCGAVPHRARPDKNVGNTDVYISKLAELVRYTVLKIIVATRLSNPVVLDVSDSLLTDPLFLAQLTIHTGQLNGSYDVIFKAAAIRTFLRERLCCGTLDPTIAIYFEDLDWEPNKFKHIKHYDTPVSRNFVFPIVPNFGLVFDD